MVNLCGGPYDFANYRAQTTVVFQNKTPTCQYRAVGHPIAVAITEGLVDMAAAAIGMDPVEIRRRNMFPDDAYPVTSPAKMRFEGLSHHASMDKLMEMMDYDALRADQAAARKEGKHRGIGIASFIELTNPSPFMYGIGGARISAQDGCTVRMDPDGSVVALSGVTEQGQGTEAMLSQVVAEGVGVSPSQVRVVTGDTQVTPYGGGTWASRGAGIGGEAALQAARALRGSILEVAAAMLQAEAGALDIRDGQVVDADTGEERMPLEELGRIVYFRGDTLPKGLPRELVQTRHFITMDYPFAFTNGVQASYLEVDTDTGVVTLLKHWCVEDCGRVINPQLVDEQIRGGIVQGLGGALYEEIHYDEDGQLLNGRWPTTCADGGRNARHGDRPCRNPHQGKRAWRKRRGRSWHGWRTCCRDECDQRRLAPAWGAGDGNALYPRTHPARAGQTSGLNQSGRSERAPASWEEKHETSSHYNGRSGACQRRGLCPGNFDGQYRLVSHPERQYLGLRDEEHLSTRGEPHPCRETATPSIEIALASRTMPARSTSSPTPARR